MSVETEEYTSDWFSIFGENLFSSECVFDDRFMITRKSSEGIVIFVPLTAQLINEKKKGFRGSTVNRKKLYVVTNGV